MVSIDAGGRMVGAGCAVFECGQSCQIRTICLMNGTDAPQDDHLVGISSGVHL